MFDFLFETIMACDFELWTPLFPIHAVKTFDSKVLTQNSKIVNRVASCWLGTNGRL